MNRLLLILGAISGLLGVALGAFGAHGLKNLVSADRLNAFEVGVRYQMYHAIALVALSAVAPKLGPLTQTAGILMALGIVLFSGSLYGLSLTGIRGLGAVTPLGGVLFIAGWIALVAGAFRPTAG